MVFIRQGVEKSLKYILCNWFLENYMTLYSVITFIIYTYNTTNNRNVFFRLLSPYLSEISYFNGVVIIYNFLSNVFEKEIRLL